MSEPETLGAAWLSFDLAVLPDGCGQTQRVETRRAFYAGAGAMFAMMTGIPEDEPDEVGCQRLDRFLAELRRFEADLATGRA